MLLIIEDSALLIELYFMAFNIIHVVPEVVITGTAALRRIKNPTSEIPDAIILDLHLRKEQEDDVEVTGIDLFTVIRATWPGTKIIVVSADKDWCDKFKGVADKVVEKPIEHMGIFLDMVQGYLKQPARSIEAEIIC